MARIDKKDNRESVVPYRVLTFAFGGVFFFFFARDISWSGGITVIGVLSVVSALAFIGLSLFGSDRLMRSLYKRRLVPEKSDRND